MAMGSMVEPARATKRLPSPSRSEGATTAAASYAGGRPPGVASQVSESASGSLWPASAVRSLPRRAATSGVAGADAPFVCAG